MMPDRVQLAWMAWQRLNDVQAPQPVRSMFGQPAEPGDPRPLSKPEQAMHNVAVETLTRFIMGSIDPDPDREQQEGPCNCFACQQKRNGGGGGMMVMPMPYYPGGQG